MISDSGLAPVTRVITGHDAQGRAVFTGEDTAPTRLIGSGDAAFLTVWGTATLPADANDPRDGRDLVSGLTIPGGSVLRVVDILPGAQSPLHRTSSVDYGVVIEGEIECELDSGQRRTIGPGGIVIQRGTSHLWRNTGTVPCRMVFVLIAAEAYIHDGQALPPIHP